MRKIVTTLLLLSLPFCAQAQEANMLPAGTTLLNISATERVEVDQDMLVANMRIEKRLADAKELQQEINLLMKKALEEAKKFEGLEVNTDQYYVYEYSTEKQKLWQGNQGLTIKSKNADDVLELTGRLQDMEFLMNGLSYQLSTEKYEETRENLLEAALQKLVTRAKKVGSIIDKPNADLWEVNVDAAPSPIYPQPMMARGMAMEMSAMDMKSAAPPSAEPGKSDISMTVSAKVLLK